MIKFIVPAVLVFLIILFWEKISENLHKRFGIRMNYIVIIISILILGIIFTLLYF